MSEPGVSLRGLRKTYAGGVTVVHDIDLDVRQGEFMVLVGPSGCGKTTIRSVVVLPQPEGPTSTMNSPCRTSRSMSCTTVTPPA